MGISLDMVRGWVTGRSWLSGALAVLIVLCLLGAPVVFAKPRLDRNWVENLAVMPVIDIREDSFGLGPATDWSYNAEGPVAKDYTTFTAGFGELKNVWFVLEPHPGMKPMAHTFILFEFADDRMIGLTVEARREANEAYSAVLGAFNKFELAYIWSTPKDLLTRRATFLAHDVLIYPLTLSADQKLAFLKSLLVKTAAVSTTPRFYNTLFSNCTNELAKTAGLKWHYAFILTGYSPERLYKLKMIPGATFAEAESRALLTQKVRDLNDLPSTEFDHALLQELRSRYASPPETADAAVAGSAN
jgi:hypothetical protein